MFIRFRLVHSGATRGSSGSFAFIWLGRACPGVGIASFAYV